MTKTNFVYGFTRCPKGGVLIPTATVAVVPFQIRKKRCLAIGVAYCSNKDIPCKKVGRRIAEARARATISAGHDIFTKVRNSYDTRCIGSVVTGPQECSIFNFSLDLTKRLNSCIVYLLKTDNKVKSKSLDWLKNYLYIMKDSFR